MNPPQIDEIWKKTDSLINHFKQYNLEKNISKVAIEYITNQIQHINTYESMKKQIENAAFEAVKTQIKQIEKQRLEEEEKQRLEEEKQRQEEEQKKEQAYENMKVQINETAIEGLKAKIQEQLQEREEEEEQDAINKIKPVAIDAVTSELVTSQIKETAIQELNNQILQMSTQELPENIKTLAKQIILKFIKTHLPLIQTIIAIKKTAIAAVTGAVAPKDNTELIKQTAIEKVNTLVLEEELYDEFENNRIGIENINQEIETINEEIKTIEDIQSPNDEDNKNLSDKRNELVKKTAEQQQLLQQMTKIAEKEIDLAKKMRIYQELVKNYKELLSVDNANQYLTQIQNLNGIVNALKQSILQNELKNVAINKVLTSLPKPPPSPPVAESKEPLIKNAAINAVKDALITELSKKIAAPVSTGPVSTGPVITAPAINIENDLKNASLTALYRALLGVPREQREPIDITKPPSEYDILITDKTYKYDEKTGERKEIPELTKYDSILAK